MASTLSDDTAPSASLDCLTARAAPTHPGAQPEPLGSLPWPQELASGRPKVEDSPLSTPRQGFCRSWEIRRAYNEVKAAAKIIQRFARTYLAHQKFGEMREDSATEPEKKREVLLKILYPHRFGKAKLGLKGGRRHRLQPQRVQGDMDDGDRPC